MQTFTAFAHRCRARTVVPLRQRATRPPAQGAGPSRIAQKLLARTRQACWGL